ncbi:type ISP restriction/modification enzyme [Qipengyuania flava]|uniref:type ISP restriction/modification enzyme n=1 Tax=Qipengyuania flava TaxID=192812 RepID=UPI00141B413E|nr:type ISP restriction/modification enzyme [Qipengyuania flava]NIJ62706.1 hypothetical protein [Qipengyuania flava]
MPDISAEELARVNSFPKLVALLRDRLEWPIDEDYEFEDVIFEYEPQELGLKKEETAKVREIHQLRPLVTNQPWGVFFISFEEKQLSVTVLRRILRALVVKQRGAAVDRQAWDKSDLIFAANFGKSGERELAFVHFSDGAATNDLPVMKVLGWNARDTKLHNDHVGHQLSKQLAWPDDPADVTEWRTQWSSAFEVRHREVISTSKELAKRLAALATDIRATVNDLLRREVDKGPLRTMLEAFRKNLIHDLDADGFADMFAQTICYGMLAARISKITPEDSSGCLVADNMADMVPRTNPFLKELFANFLKLGGRDKDKALDFDELGVRNVVDMLNRANMDRVLEDFGNRNPRKDPVIHFYEDFLREYDSEQKVDAGIFYTPPAVVGFIVRGVDEMLRTEFDLPLGLADTTTWGELAKRNDKITVPDHIDPNQPFVQILDPATGTGTFLVEVIDLIHKRMIEHWQGEKMSSAEIKAAWDEYVPTHLLPRLTAFELKMAAYSIAHMKIGLKLVETGYTFGSDERAHILLTNTLQPPRELDLDERARQVAFAHEAERANVAKQCGCFTVVIGNPPYKGESMNPSRVKGKLTHAGKLVQRFFQVRGQSLNERNSKWLNNDYVKFIGFAMNEIETSSHGVFGYINSNTWLDRPLFRGVRTEFEDCFPVIRIVDLHGNIGKRETADDGTRDEGVFAIEEGTNIAIAARIKSASSIKQHDLLGPLGDGNGDGGKLDWLETHSLRGICTEIYPLTPMFKLTPMETTVGGQNPLQTEYYALTGLPHLLPLHSAGIVTSNDDLSIQFDPTDMQTVAREFLNVDLQPLLDERDIKGGATIWKLEVSPHPVRVSLKKKKESQDWQVEYAQRDLMEVSEIDKNIIPITYRPFDMRFTVYTGNSGGFHCRPRPDVMKHLVGGENIALISARSNQSSEMDHFFCSRFVTETKSGERTAQSTTFPLWLRREAGEKHKRSNFEPAWARRCADQLHLTFLDGIPHGEQQSMGSDYRHQKAKQIGLLDQPWDGRGDLEKDFGPRDLFDWIYAILHAPSYRSRYAEFLKSDFPRIPIPKDRATFAALVLLGQRLVALHLLKHDDEPVLQNPDIRYVGTSKPQIGQRRTSRGGFPQWENGKVTINESCWFEDVPKATWEFTVGGYQPLSKWIEDRAGKGGQNPRPGRVLTEEDILHYRRVVTALTETRKIMAEIDQAIEEQGGWPDAFAIGTDTDEGE